MSAAVRTPAARHIHLPSVHLRREDGSGYDYEEDLDLFGRRRQRVVRVVRLTLIEHGEEVLVRETRDILCPEELAVLEETLPLLMDEGNPEANALMEERAQQEMARQLRIARGAEQACAVCGCSETRACSGGCVWASERLCSRCV